jgi:MscS family membrane protein
MRSLFFVSFSSFLTATQLSAADAPAAPVMVVKPSVPSAAAAESTQVLEHFVDWLHQFFPGVNETLFHWLVCLIVIVAAIFLRHVVTNIIFSQLKRLASKTETTLDDKLFPALERPVATLIMVAGIFAALTVLKSSTYDQVLFYGAQVSFTIVIFWGMFCAGGAIFDHLQEVSAKKKLGIAAFMPLIKKTLAVVFIIFGVLMLAQTLGADVKAFLAGLGIGGLAFALAAQDTIANMFGSFVVVMDHPFRVGDVVKIGTHEGLVEDIGLRSTKLRTGARAQIIIPNKSVASEAIVNFSRMPQRKVEQTLGLTYDTTPEQLRGILDDIRGLLSSDPDIHGDLTVAHFVEYGESSLNIQVMYFASDPNWKSHMVLRERINFKIMDIVKARGSSFAFPTRTLQFEGPLAQAWIDKQARPKSDNATRPEGRIAPS